MSGTQTDFINELNKDQKSRLKKTETKEKNHIPTKEEIEAEKKGGN